MTGSGDEDDKGGGGNVREQDRFLPIANISRIMKKALPNNAKIAKDAKETVQECVSEFISFITSEASDKCQREKRKTINGDDLLWAMTTLGFEDYIEPLKLYLQKFREAEAALAKQQNPNAAGPEVKKEPTMPHMTMQQQPPMPFPYPPGMLPPNFAGMQLPPGMLPMMPGGYPPPHMPK